MARNWMQHTIIGSEEYCIFLGEIRLQIRRYWKERGMKIWENIIRRRIQRWIWDTWLGWRGKGGLHRSWTGVRSGSVAEADREKPGRKLHVYVTSDAWI